MPDSAEAKLFHERAKAAGDQLGKYVLSISVAATGLFFVTLTGDKTVMSTAEKGFLAAALVLFACTVLICLAQLHVNARRYYELAKQNESQTPDWSRNERMKKARVCLIYSSYATTAVGVLATLVYLLMRIG